MSANTESCSEYTAKIFLGWKTYTWNEKDWESYIPGHCPCLPLGRIVALFLLFLPVGCFCNNHRWFCIKIAITIAIIIKTEKESSS